jgi:hypothetical protein
MVPDWKMLGNSRRIGSAATLDALPPPLGRAATAARARRRGCRGWLRYPENRAAYGRRSSTRRLWRPPTPELACTMDFAQGPSRIFLRDATIEHMVCYNCSKSLRQQNNFFASFCPVFLQLAGNYLLRCYNIEFLFCYDCASILHL